MIISFAHLGTWVFFVVGIFSFILTLQNYENSKAYERVNKLGLIMIGLALLGDAFIVKGTLVYSLAALGGFLLFAVGVALFIIPEDEEIEWDLED